MTNEQNSKDKDERNQKAEKQLSNINLFFSVFIFSAPFSDIQKDITRYFF